MKPNDKAIDAAVAAIDKYYLSSAHKNHTQKEAMSVALTAAYAAQFKSEEYAGLVKWLRDKAESLSEIYPPEAEAADALEAVLAERDDFAEQLALRSENGISKDLQEFLRKFKEDDSAAIRMFAQYRDLEIEMDSWKSLWEKTNAHMRQVESERDALLARLAPVDDEELVEIVAKHIIDATSDMPPRTTYSISESGYVGARAAIAAIRPHIEAAERERCAKIAEARFRTAIDLPDGYINGWGQCQRSIAAAIRSGK